MDILHLVDRLEETIKSSRRLVPFSSLRVIDEQRVWAIVDQMRISIPEQVRRGQRITQERDQILAEARQRAEGLVREAEERATEMVSEHSVAQAAEARAAAIREKAERESSVLRLDANEYVFNSLCQLEEELRRTLQVVENGIHRIQVEQAEAERQA
ncbi:MAG: hypothetical protein JW900_12095 [Anaerolineae bacterium]|nr:hypothetical protein [Anaerolineae bacterium]